MGIRLAQTGGGAAKVMAGAISGGNDPFAARYTLPSIVFNACKVFGQTLALQKGIARAIEYEAIAIVAGGVRIALFGKGDMVERANVPAQPRQAGLYTIAARQLILVIRPAKGIDGGR